MKAVLKLRTVPWFVFVAVSFAAQLAAQNTPDFSGEWVLESTSQTGPDIPRALSVSQSVVRTNVRGEPMKPFFKDVTVARRLETGTRSETYQIGVVGGTVSGRATGSTHGPSNHYRVVWEEQSLVIENESYRGLTPDSGQWAARREVWSLDSPGRLRLEITTRDSVGASRTITLVYRRKS
jgi:hypothetical protein